MIKTVLTYQIEKIGMVDFTKFSSDDLLELALRCRHNAIVLRDSANRALENEKSKNHALFLMYSAAEEFEKGFFCLLVHRDIMKKSQLEPVFKQHKTKIILFKMLFRNPSFYVKNGKFYYDGTLFENLDLVKIADLDKTVYQNYMNERNDCLYVKPNDDGSTYDPSNNPNDIESKRKEIVDKISYLWALFEAIWTNDFNGDFGNFDYYKLTPTGKPEEPNIIFNGSGILTQRTDYYPDSVKDRLGILK